MFFNNIITYTTGIYDTGIFEEFAVVVEKIYIAS